MILINESSFINSHPRWKWTESTNQKTQSAG